MRRSGLSRHLPLPRLPLSGEAPPDLNMETSNRVRRLVPTLVRVLQQHNLDKETDYLENYRGPQTKYRY